MSVVDDLKAARDAHTPGPYTTRRALHPMDGEYDYAIVAEIDGRKYCIAEAYGRCADMVLLPAEANARLFGAAPDLLAALQYVMSAHGEQLHEAFEMAHAAIAKATGEPL